jgi:3-hydroxyacyl-[acyl-carrier-protein] dehydratase
MIAHADLRAVLPHRYPMLMVDRVLSIEPGRSIVATKAVTGVESCYARLPAAAPASAFAYPVTLLVESLCQAGGVLLALARPGGLRGSILLFGGVCGIRPGRPVFPGDTVTHHVEMLKALSDAAMFAGHSLVDGERVLEVASVTVAVRPAGTLPPEGGSS